MVGYPLGYGLSPHNNIFANIILWLSDVMNKKMSIIRGFY